jgi:hypothetical protein
MDRPPPEAQAQPLDEVLPLSDARQRLADGRKHLVELDELLKAMPNPEDNCVVVDYKEQLRKHVVAIHLAVLPDPDATRAATEAVHSLRASLDYVAWQLALRQRAGDDPPEDEAREMTFPICDHSNSLAGAQILGHVGKDAAKELRLHQPYAKTLGGAHNPALLSTLRDLDNFSKHRLLMLRGQSFANVPLHYRFDRPITRLRAEVIAQTKGKLGRTLPLTIPQYYLRVETADGETDVKVEVDPQPTVSPVFGSFGVDIDFDELKATADCVEFIVDRIDKRFFPLMPGV